jgi:hypothetical protein
MMLWGRRKEKDAISINLPDRANPRLMVDALNLYSGYTATFPRTQRDWLRLSSSQSLDLQLDIPSFFVLGPPRTGTSWLHEVLNQHTNLPTPTKETRFFDSHFHRGMDWYRRHFPVLRSGYLTGEVAPTYFCCPEARERIAQTVPHAKLIFIFREPVGRVVSLYRMKRAYGMLPWTLEEALDRDPELLESGKYATHLAAWQKQFPADQLLITFHDDLRNAPQAYMDQVSAFLEIPQIQLTASDLGHVHSSERMTEPRNFLITKMALSVGDWLKARNLDDVVASVRDSNWIKLFLGGGEPFEETSDEARAKITAVLRPELEAFEAMTGRTFPSWRKGFTSNETAKTAIV